MDEQATLIFDADMKYSDLFSLFLKKKQIIYLKKKSTSSTKM